jgi:hypothetical protein
LIIHCLEDCEQSPLGKICCYKNVHLDFFLSMPSLSTVPSAQCTSRDVRGFFSLKFSVGSVCKGKKFHGSSHVRQRKISSCLTTTRVSSSVTVTHSEPHSSTADESTLWRSPILSHQEVHPRLGNSNQWVEEIRNFSWKLVEFAKW